eukprot:TRINITY_DN9201_c0_g1_i4.p1 TRINITY_DN9201_c0_g1~~TRINITY_DN9201_c0_g1_i4.p1  ORF type:complete len:200 (-),score=29.92 TRINITY_DN9201_c0_g1_i4:533-1132(-)
MSMYMFCGTTAIIVLIVKDMMYIAAVGDSRLVLTRGGEPVRMTYDHKPSLPAEKARIQSVGGYVEDGRVNGTLSVSRVLGDSFLQPMVSCVPYRTTTPLHLRQLSENTHAMYAGDDLDDYFILACDGLWDVLTDYEASMIVRSLDYYNNPQAAAEVLRDVAFSLGSMDNISVLVFAFNSTDWNTQSTTEHVLLSCQISQ